MDTAQSKVKLLGPAHAEVIHVERLKHAKLSCSSWILQAVSQGLELNHFRHLDVLDDTLTSVLTEVACIDSKAEAVSLRVKDFDVRQVVQLSHAFNLDELDEVTVLVSVTLVLVHMDSWFVALLDATDDELLGLLTILISDLKLRTVVKESVGHDSESLTENEAFFLGAAKLIDLDEALGAPEFLSDDNDVVVGNHLVCEIGDQVGLDIWVELAKLRHGSFCSSHVASITLLDVEVGAAVRN